MLSPDVKPIPVKSPLTNKLPEDTASNKPALVIVTVPTAVAVPIT